jgi:S-DNA-T family DNA segregation ATPase FtsK/SpoIIIE
MVTLIYASAVIGAIPRMGKTFAVRLLLLAAALDVRGELHPYDLKGTGDFDALEPVSHRFRAGDDRGGHRVRAGSDLTALAGGDAAADEGDPVAAEGRVPGVEGHRPTRVGALVRPAPDLGRGRRVPALVRAPRARSRKFEEICADLVRRGPATGIMLLLSTQRPDAKSIPKVISDNAVMRFCLKVLGHHANDMVLGSGMWTAGYQAATFAFEDKGIGLLAGEGDAPRIVRTAYVDGRQAEQVVARARAHAGRGGHDHWGTPPVRRSTSDAGRDFSLLADLLTVMGEDKAHSDVCVRGWPSSGRTGTTAGGRRRSLAR